MLLRSLQILLTRLLTKEYAAANLTLDLIFDASNTGAKYMGVDGKTYYMSLSDDAKTLYASQKADNSGKQVCCYYHYR
jgi:hypothetical protein